MIGLRGTDFHEPGQSGRWVGMHWTDSGTIERLRGRAVDRGRVAANAGPCETRVSGLVDPADNRTSLSGVS